MRVSAGAVWLGFGMLVCAQAQASDSSVGVEQSPDIELLEYLGDLVQQKGHWVGPDDMKGLPNGHEAPIARDYPGDEERDVGGADVLEDEVSGR
jgi:hypothetical protein